MSLRTLHLTAMSDAESTNRCFHAAATGASTVARKHVPKLTPLARSTKAATSPRPSAMPPEAIYGDLCDRVDLLAHEWHRGNLPAVTASFATLRDDDVHASFGRFVRLPRGRDLVHHE